MLCSLPRLRLPVIQDLPVSAAKGVGELYHILKFLKDSSETTASELKEIQKQLGQKTLRGEVQQQPLVEAIKTPGSLGVLIHILNLSTLQVER